MNLEDMLRTLANDVESLLRRSGDLKSDERHPVAQVLDDWAKEKTDSETNPEPQETTGA